MSACREIAVSLYTRAHTGVVISMYMYMHTYFTTCFRELFVHCHDNSRVISLVA